MKSFSVGGIKVYFVMRSKLAVMRKLLWCNCELSFAFATLYQNGVIAATRLDRQRDLFPNHFGISRFILVNRLSDQERKNNFNL